MFSTGWRSSARYCISDGHYSVVSYCSWVVRAWRNPIVRGNILCELLVSKQEFRDEERKSVIIISLVAVLLIKCLLIKMYVCNSRTSIISTIWCCAPDFFFFSSRKSRVAFLSLSLSASSHVLGSRSSSLAYLRLVSTTKQDDNKRHRDNEKKKR